MKKQNSIIIAIIGASVLIAAALVFLGMQMRTSGNLDAAIQKGIETYVKNQQEAQAKAQAAAQNRRIEGDFEDDDPFIGKEDAPVVLIEWSDYQCPFCRRFYNDTLPKIKEKYIDTGKLKFVYRDFPLSFHPFAKPAANAANCAREQGGDDTYFAYHDKIFEVQNALGSGTVNPPEGTLEKIAQELNLDMNRFTSCLESEKYADEIQKDFLDGQKAAVRGTPGFLLNGRPISGAQPYVLFEQMIEEELSKINS